MLVYQPSRYFSFFNYCRQRKLCCKTYHSLKHKRILGEISQKNYFLALKELHYQAVELEIKYFDILGMRL